MTQSAFDPARHRWRKVTVPGDLASYKIHHDYTILGHDLAISTPETEGEITGRKQERPAIIVAVAAGGAFFTVRFKNPQCR